MAALPSSPLLDAMKAVCDSHLKITSRNVASAMAHLHVILGSPELTEAVNAFALEKQKSPFSDELIRLESVTIPDRKSRIEQLQGQLVNLVVTAGHDHQAHQRAINDAIDAAQAELDKHERRAAVLRQAIAEQVLAEVSVLDVQEKILLVLNNSLLALEAQKPKRAQKSRRAQEDTAQTNLLTLDEVRQVEMLSSHLTADAHFSALTKTCFNILNQNKQAHTWLTKLDRAAVIQAQERQSDLNKEKWKAWAKASLFPRLTGVVIGASAIALLVDAYQLTRYGVTKLSSSGWAPAPDVMHLAIDLIDATFDCQAWMLFMYTLPCFFSDKYASKVRQIVNNYASPLVSSLAVGALFEGICLFNLKAVVDPDLPILFACPMVAMTLAIATTLSPGLEDVKKELQVKCVF